MMQSRSVEIAVGLFVALAGAALLMLALKVSNLSALYDHDGYHVKAYFGNIGGLKVKSAVRMAGVKVGEVAAIEFDDGKSEALVTLKLNQRYQNLPKDSSASIYTSGLLGEQYVGLEAGGDDQALQEGDTLMLTQSAVVLEQLIGQFLYKAAAGGGG